MQIKNQSQILQKLGITALNPMQESSQLAIHATNEVMILSPTGTGKTLAFLLPLVAVLDPAITTVQALILVPSRELAIQIEQVLREMGTGYKVNAVYGGQKIAKDKLALQHAPAILVGTPGRVADHIRRGSFWMRDIKVLVLDEFDKSLEVGFEEAMSEIIQALPKPEKTILTSATSSVAIPDFLPFKSPLVINHLDEQVERLQLKKIVSPTKDKLATLGDALRHLGNQPGIVFCNYRDAIQRISDFLTDLSLPHGCFHGGLEQRERERTLIKFRNGTHQLILATDLAARGLDIPEIKFIIHYHLPVNAEAFTHRNGRTARMHQEGTAFVLAWQEERLPDFIPNNLPVEKLEPSDTPPSSDWTTIMVSGGRRDKISKGDIAGLFFKQGKLKNDQVGMIELKTDCAFVAVKSEKAKQLIQLVDGTKLKRKKVRVVEV